MYHHILRISQIIKILTEQFPVNKNPIEMRMGPLLMEMEWAVKQLLSILEAPTLIKENLKSVVSILYRDDEATDPLMRAWVRASTWMGSPKLQEVKKAQKMYESIKEELKNMVPHVEAIFGEEESRYIIPPLFRPKKG
ncbi:hypothetical protein [Neobacillus sp. D3-1R]|uniref:hypothetical protein n=1 Tax=Neobacillus sp. D3-1R TaxID=3445778 RepID=UPI003F9FFAD9